MKNSLRSSLTRRMLATLALLAHASLFAMPSSHLIFLGTYTTRGGQGIYAVRLDGETGALSVPTVVAEAPDPAWITFSPDKKFLYAINASQVQAVGFSVDAAKVKLTPLPATKTPDAQPPSHLAVDATGRTLLAANYREGFVASMPIGADGTLGTPTKIPHSGSSVNKERQAQPHVHSVTLSPDNRFVIVCDLGLDKIFSYALDPAAAKLTLASTVATAPGAGPRHFKFGADGKRAYAINEMGGTIAAYDYDAATGVLTPRQTVSTLPDGYDNRDAHNTAAEIRVHPNGKFLVGSNRGHDSLAVFAIDQKSGLLTPVEIVASGGKVPRNFAFSPDGKWLVCAHQDSNNLTVFRVDAASGRLTRTKSEATVPACVCVLFYD